MEKAEKEAREKQLAQQQAAAKAVRHPPSPRTSTASGSVPRSPNTPAPAKKDHTKEPVEKAVWKSLNPVLHALNEVADYWERLEK